ncbi:hypothetical protein [Marinomonas sp. ef1]|uniref:hypothetical protein n=1 Tax=Marinomonas sp. ef1 TaxID=2005043 RepID=UPI0018E26889|nr:hypothetical protein [Marinomonas sp. ef1]
MSRVLGRLRTLLSDPLFTRHVVSVIDLYLSLTQFRLKVTAQTINSGGYKSNDTVSPKAIISV